MSLQAASPFISATVTASAGSGKTWLLVSRMLRLLLHGAEPGSILALTFTRKAAGEMKARLTERLREMALATDDELDTLLIALDEKPTAELKQTARLLYEQLLFADFPVRTLTFHSFCQDILSRFPIEANVPPAFELVESNGLLIQQSIQQLYSEATISPDGELALQLETLLSHCKSIDSTKTALKSFIDHRSDWWSYTENQADTVAYAIEQLATLLKIDPDAEPASLLFGRDLPQKLERFRELHMQIATDKQMLHAQTIALVLAMQTESKQAFLTLLPAFMTQKMEPQKRKVSIANRKKLGDSDANEYLELHDEISERLLDILDLIARQQTMERNRAWYQAGNHLLNIYQRLKSQLRSLDFTDLEWRSYQLLKHSDNAHWVQYKLDQRINHFLIDEFQDTNPTQWHLLQPLLEELAAGDEERARSIFIVGDEKQSIYGFRRANPELQSFVASWLTEQANAHAFPLNKSWRSSPAIINTVNAIFRSEEGDLLQDFPEHGTHKEQMAGQVECYPLFAAPDKAEEPEPQYFRNPLQEARRHNKNPQYEAEANWIADKIKLLISQKLVINKDNTDKIIDYDDIYILVRNRTHVKTIEQQLRQQQIPFISADRGTLLESLEIKDLEMLLESLVSPFNDLAIAQLLKSPIFSATDSDLQQLAAIKTPKRWFKKLEVISQSLEPTQPLRRAHELLGQWRKLADLIPVHDLLDKIFYQSNLINRYLAATPPSMQTQVKANLLSFLELALDVDSGRYPSITHFLYQLRSLKKMPDSEAPNEAASNSGQARVNIMTIHASKGLEAPVVFLADTANKTSPKLAHQAMVHWPATSKKPVAFHLMGTRQQWDNVSKKYVDIAAGFEQREDMNLLYVALTRARQYLFVSASQPGKNLNADTASWYELILKGMNKLCPPTDEALIYTVGHNTYSATAATQTETIPTPLQIDPALSQPVFYAADNTEITPSHTDDSQHDTSDQNEDKKLQGTVIHRMLELLTSGSALTAQQILLQVKTEAAEVMSDAEYNDCLQEAQSLVQQPELQFLFDTTQYQRSYNELPIHYHDKGKSVHGVIDRVVLTENVIYMIDYKTTRVASSETEQILKERYARQLSFYQNGLVKVWPKMKIKPMLLLTHSAKLIDCSDAVVQ